jgi:hypothetical protein
MPARLFGAFAAFAIGIACAHSEAQSSGALPGVTPARWVSGVPTTGRFSTTVPLQWVLGDYAGRPRQRVALAAMAQVNGHACAIQIDTGLDADVAWNGQDPSTREGNAHVLVALAGNAGRLPSTPEQVAMASDCASQGIIGSIGNGFFDTGTLRIDLEAPSLTWTDGSTLSERPDAQPLFYPCWGGQGGHAFVELKSGGRLLGYAMLDTGSAASDFSVLDLPAWKATTGGAPLEAGGRVRAFDIPAWGRSHTCYAASMTGDLDVGGVRLHSPQVTYCPDLGFESPMKIAGVLGMHAFGDATLVVDYAAGRWLVEAPR